MYLRNETFENGTVNQNAVSDYEIYWKRLWLAVLLHSSGTLVFGLVSWILIPKWRLFHNYVFLNIVLSGSMNMCSIFFPDNFRYYSLWSMYVTLMFNHWLIVSTIMFYMDLVIVFSGFIQHKFLKATIFAWTLPAVLLVPKILWKVRIYIFSMIEVFLMFILYLKVLHALLLINKYSNREQKRIVVVKVLKSTVTFLLSSFIFVFFNCVLIFMFQIEQEVKAKVYCCFQTVTMILTSLFLLLSKDNIRLWIQYVEHREST